MAQDFFEIDHIFGDENFKKPKLFLLDNSIWLLLIITIGLFAILNGRQFFNVSNIRFIIYSSVMLGFLVMAEGICLLSGNFDLSVGQAAGFAAMLNAMLLTSWAPWLPWYLGVVTIIIIGALIGSVNGFFVAKMDLNPFLVTLGTFFVLQFGTLAISLNPIRAGLPDEYLALGGSLVSGIPIAIVLLVIAAIILHVLLRHMRFGSNIYAVGGDPESSNRVGISVTNTVFAVFVLSGILSAIAGLLFTGFLSSATPGMADGSVFMAFAGAVIGGVSLQGGRGSLVNMIGGALLIGVFQAGLVMSGLSGNMVNIFFGVLVILAVIFNRVRENVRDKLLMPN